MKVGSHPNWLISIYLCLKPPLYKNIKFSFNVFSETISKQCEKSKLSQGLWNNIAEYGTVNCWAVHNESILSNGCQTQLEFLKKYQNYDSIWRYSSTHNLYSITYWLLRFLFIMMLNYSIHVHLFSFLTH